MTLTSTHDSPEGFEVLKRNHENVPDNLLGSKYRPQATPSLRARASEIDDTGVYAEHPTCCTSKKEEEENSDFMK
jgi:hypothetical protein